MILDYVVNANDKQHVEENDAQSVKQNGEQDRPHFETIGFATAYTYEF